MANDAPVFAPDAQVQPLTQQQPTFAADAKVEPLPGMDAGEMVSQAVGNAPGSALQFLKDTVRPIMHPQETIQGVGDLLQGLAAKHKNMYRTEMGAPAQPDEHEKFADAMGQYLTQRYGGIEEAKKSFAQDPVGVLADFSTVATGGGTLMERLPGVLGRTGEVMSTIGRATDPLMAPVNAARVGAGIVGETLTHTGAPALEHAYRSGVEGGDAGEVFRDNMRGTASPEEAVNIAKQGLEQFRQDRGARYRDAMEKMSLEDQQFDPHDRILDFRKIEQAVDKATGVQTFKGYVLDPGAEATRADMIHAIEDWRELSPATYHTVEGIDALKRLLGSIMMDTQPNTAARKAAGDIYNAVKKTITDYYPQYAKTMQDYERASDTIRDIEKSLSLGEKASVDTALRKLQSIMRNNVNTNYGRRLQLGQLLEENGATHLMAALAGQQLNTWFPRGLGKLAADFGVLGVAGHSLSPWALATAPFMSPRLMGETAHAAGRTIGRSLAYGNRGLGRVGLSNRSLGNLSYRLGRGTNPAENTAPFKSGGRVGYDGGGDVPDDGAMMPETYVNPFANALVRTPEYMARGVGRLIDTARETPYGLRRGDYTDIPGDEQPIDPLVRESFQTGLNTMGTGAIAGVPVKGAEAVLGSGVVRKTAERANAAKEVQAAAPEKAPRDVAQGVAGTPGGSEGVQQARLQAERRAAGRQPLPGLPQEEQIVDGELFTPGPVARVQDVADRYMADKDYGFQPPEKYHELDKVHARNIAKAFDKMKHAPDDPAVKASYEALIRETLAQYQAIKESGLEITPVGAADYPYGSNPRAVAKDVADNNHMAFFKTEGGFGTGVEADQAHPMLRKSGEKIGDYEMLNNDLFRVVHDYFGHIKNGYGFRAAGEDNAWRSHAAMYSPEARPAMTSETRGQNSWVNYGPHGDFNRTASGADTIYSPQKVGLMPEWTMADRINSPATMRGKGLLFNDEGLPIKGKNYSRASDEILAEIAAGKKGAGPLDLSLQGRIPDVPQVPMDRYEPMHGVSERLQDALKNKDVVRGVAKSIEAGRAMGADKWYHTEAIRRAFIEELGHNYGPVAFARYMDHVAATSPRSALPENIRNASFQYQHAQAGQDLPKQPYPYGHIGQQLHRRNYKTLTAPEPGDLSAASTPGASTRWNIYDNPKPASFSQNLQGNLVPVTVDTHAFKNIGMRTRDPRFLETSLTQEIGDKPVGPQGQRYGELKNGILTYRPQKLFESGQLSMKDALNIPSFWRGKPNANEYAAAEKFYTDLGRKAGLAPADTQAAAWSGAGELTGLESPPTHTFPEAFNERVLFTAKMRGESPRQTLRDFIRGKKPLLARGGSVKGYADGGAPDDDEAAMSPETYVNPFADALVRTPEHMARGIGALMDTARDTPFGLRREDFTDIPGNEQPIDPLVGRSFDTSLNTMGAGMLGAERDAAGIFGGKLAEHANKQTLHQAEMMERAGADRDTIWSRTGWYQGPEGEWRFEIPDEKARLTGTPFRPMGASGDFAPQRLRDVLEHPEFYKQYPELSQYKVIHDPKMGKNAEVDTEGGIIRINMNNPRARQTLLHEVQHAVQDTESFTRGTSPQDPVLMGLPEVKNTKTEAAYQQARRDAYWRAAGEVEARNVMRRANFGPVARRVFPPWESEDIPAAQQHVLPSIHEQMGINPFRRGGRS